MKELELNDANGYYKGTMIYGHIAHSATPVNAKMGDQSLHLAPGRFPQYTVIRTEKIGEGPRGWRVVSGNSGFAPDSTAQQVVSWGGRSHAADLEMCEAIDYARELAEKWGMR